MDQDPRCERCDTRLTGGDPRCLICGFLNGTPCPHCETLMPLEAEICTACGTTIKAKDTEQAPPAKVVDLDSQTEDSLDLTSLPEVPQAAAPPQESQPASGTVTQPMPGQSKETAATARMPKQPAEPEIRHRDGSENHDSVLELASGDLLEPSGNTVNLDAAVPEQTATPDRKATRRIDAKDYESILQTCRQETGQGTRLFGLFGRPEAGKTSFIYSVGKLIQNGRSEGSLRHFGNLDGDWKNLLADMDRMFEAGTVRGTERGLHPYKARPVSGGFRNKPFMMLDINGEQFEQIDDWSEEITQFFITYLRQCSGFFLFLDIDEDTIAPSKADVIDRWAREKKAPLEPLEKQRAIDVYNYKSSQMAHMVAFLSVAAQVPRIADGASYQQQKSDLEKARREENIGKHQLDIPVALCVSKADRLKDFKFRDYPAIIPGSDGPWGDPWDVIGGIWGGHLENMKRIVPHLKVEWVSNLGDNFKPKRGIGRPRGVDSVFDFVIGEPPPAWALSSRRYFQWRKWLKV